ncbi:MAG: DUF4258 domain-containing protein [Crocinitomicaceae bacterium]|nr:DUF4258 domain-containing protein [Crocinitomicaceae bacterium]
MENFLRRLKFYGVGFGFGMIFLFFFFQNRGCSWLPGNRVKNSILDRVLVVSDVTASIMEERGLGTDDIVAVLNDGDVDFDASDKEGDSKVYIVERDGVNYAFTLPYESFISEVFIDAEANNLAPSTEGYGDIIRFPADDNIVFPDTLDHMKCQQDSLDLEDPKEILRLLKENGKIDFAKSNLSERPKPMHYLVFTRDGEEIGAKVIWYKTKLKILVFEGENVPDCME